MTQIFKQDGREIRKWRAQATRAGEALKAQDFAGKDEVKFGFCFDDGVVTVTMKTERIREFSAGQLGDLIYDAVLAEVHTNASTGGNA